MDGARGARNCSFGIAKAGLLLPAVRMANERGLPLETLIKTVGLPENFGEDPGALLPSRLWHGLYVKLERALGDANVGWNLAMAQPLAAYSHEFTRGISEAPSLLKAFEFINHYGSRHCNTHNVRISLAGDYGYIYHHSGIDDGVDGNRQRALGRAASIIVAVREFLGADWVPDLVAFNFPVDELPDDEIGDGARWIRCQRPSYVRVQRDLLSARCRNPIISTYHSNDVVATDFQGAIRQVLDSYVLDGSPDLDQVAEMLGYSRRTLQRRLNEAGASYSNIVAESKYQVATKLLEDWARITDVAFTLGYTDVSHFTRFFTRYAGVPPGRYRRLIREGVIAANG